MYHRILNRMREKIRSRQYVMTVHAEEEMDTDSFSIFDVESGILSGDIRERQRDQSTGEWKYVIEGQTLIGDSITIVAKISETETLVILTVWRE